MASLPQWSAYGVVRPVDATGSNPFILLVLMTTVLLAASPYLLGQVGCVLGRDRPVGLWALPPVKDLETTTVFRRFMANYSPLSRVQKTN